MSHRSQAAYRNQIRFVDQLIVALCVHLKHCRVLAIHALPIGLKGEYRKCQSGQKTMRNHFECIKNEEQFWSSMKLYISITSKDDT